MNTRLVMPLMFWSACLVAPLPLLGQHLFRLWQIDQYQYFPVLMLTVAALIVTRWNRELHFPRGWFAWAAVACGLLLIGLGAVVNSPWAATVGWLLALGSWLASHQQSEPSGGSLLYLWFPTWLLVRLPFGLDLKLTNNLQQVTSAISSDLLDVLAIPHTRNGNVFELPSGAMLVEEACSGVQSLFSLLFCAFMLVAWLRRSPVLLPFYALAAVVSALIMNIGRVLAIAVAQEWYQVDLAHGTLHEVLGYVCLGLAILLLVSADCLLRVVFFPVPESVEESNWNPVQHLWNLSFMTGAGAKRVRTRQPREPFQLSHQLNRPLAIILLILAAGLWLPQLRHLAAKPAVAWESGKAAMWNPQKQLFNSIPELTIVKHSSSRNQSDPVLGENSDVWEAVYQGLNIQVVVSQPYPEFHDLAWCYKGQGWEQTDVANHADVSWKYVVSTLVKPPRQFGFLIYSGLGRDGMPVGPLEVNPFNFIEEWMQWRSQNAYAGAQGCQMIQLFVTTEEPLSQDQVATVTELHHQLRDTMRSAYQRVIGNQQSGG